MKKYFEIGMKVYDVRFGEGLLHYIAEDCVHVIYDNFLIKTYTHDGRWFAEEKVCLFKREPTIYVNEEIITFEKLELVLVWTGRKYEMLYYSHSYEGQHYCYDDQKKNGFHTGWQQVFKFSENPLLEVEPNV